MFKRAPAGQDFSICLQCQFRLNLRRSSPTSSRRQQRRPLAAAFHHHPSSRLRPFTSDSSPRYGDDEQPHVSTDDATSPPPPHFSRYEGGSHARPIRYRPPPPKTPLGVDSMGEPAEVLVLHKPPQAARNMGVIFTEEPEHPFPTTLEGSSEALLDGIDQERGIVDLDQACANIDRVRDAFMMVSRQGNPATLAPDEYDELVSKLLAGFDKKHLAAYWRRSGSKANTDALNLHFPYSSTLFARSAWTPGLTSLEQAKAPPLKEASEIQAEATLGRLSLPEHGKKWYAENILQKCWGLHQEQVDATGEMILRLQETHLQLLLNHKNDPLKRFSKTYSVKLEASRKRNLIRVECDYATSEDVLRMFIHILESIKSSVVFTGAGGAKADGAAAKGLDIAYIKEVEKLTNTTVVANRTSQRHTANVNPREYTIYYLGPDQDDLEDARRLLNVETNASISKSSGHILVELPIPPTASVIPVDFGDGIPLMARSTPWARFGNPSTRKSETGVEKNHPPIAKFTTSISESVEVLDQVTEFLRGPEDKPIKGKLQMSSYEYWEGKATRWSRVVLGQLAFPLQQARRMETKLKKPKPNISYRNQTQNSVQRLQRIFGTTVPGITRVVEASTMSMLPTERLLIRMLPASSPTRPSAVLGRVPQLEIQINVHTKERTTTFAAARLVLSHHELDLLLPSHTTDVRFVRRLNLYADREQKNPRLIDFVNASNFDIWGSERLRTPNDLQISIPSCLIPGTEENEPLSDNGLLPIDYKFASLEHRSDLNLPLLGTNRPQYTTIEAGRLGGRRDELAINLGPDVNSAYGKEDEENQRLVNEPRARSLLKAASSMIGIVESDEQGPRLWTENKK